MPTRKQIAPGSKVGLKLTATDRKLILNELMYLEDNYSEVIRETTADQPVQFTLDEWEDFGGYIAAEANHSEDARREKKLDAISNKIQKILDTHTEEDSSRTLKTEDAKKTKAAKAKIFQLKITLAHIKPPIWRRIQIENCTLDKLHEHIQTAMGWTNSHLHQFEIAGAEYGDPELLCECFDDEPPPGNSLRVKLSQVIPKDGKRFLFSYEYDFGDSWEHGILFEGFLEAKKGTRYPVCIEGKRACPPEDIGGPYGYMEYLEAIADPKHEEHEEFLEWIGEFEPEHFDARAATKAMHEGLPNWREAE